MCDAYPPFCCSHARRGFDALRVIILKMYHILRLGMYLVFIALSYLVCTSTYEQNYSIRTQERRVDGRCKGYGQNEKARRRSRSHSTQKL